jgi:hypothetical protein
MAVGGTLIADIIVPTHFAPYVIERTSELSVFFRSGIIATEPEFDEMATMGGTLNSMPFWTDITAASQVLSDQTRMNVNKIAAGRDMSMTHVRGNAWSVNDLSKYLSGDDPLGAIEDLVAEYWARDMEKMLIASLQGIFNSTTMAGSVATIGSNATGTPTLVSGNYLTGQSFIDGKYLLGDNAEKLVAIAIHSQIEASLLKLDLIDFIPQSQGEPAIKKFQGLDVIVDDHVPVDRTGAFPVYTTYLFGEGAFAMGTDNRAGDPLQGGFGTWAVELGRDPLAGDTNLINRKRFILHPRGVQWTNAVCAGVSPTNAELANGTNWNRVYEQKNVRLAAIESNAAPNRKAALT